MRRVAVTAILVFLSGCSLAFGSDDGPESFGGGDGGSVPGGVEPVAAPGDAAPPEEAADAELESTCDGSGPTRVTLSPLAAGGLGSVQYSAAALEAMRWPDGSNLSVDDFRAYFSDKQPLTAPQLAARFTLSSATDGVLSLRFRLPRPQAREPLHIVAVADVSLSASDLAAFREGVLADLAKAADRADVDRISLVTYGESPEVLFEALATENEATLKTFTGDKTLPEKDGNNLAAAIERAQGLLDGERGHIVVLSDGGQAMNENIASSVDAARSAGHLVSAIQFAAPIENDAGEAAFFYNGALLAGIARRGGGSHLYANELVDPDNGESILSTRYEELFPIVASDVSVTVTLPSGVTSTLPIPDGTGVPPGLSVSAIRGFGVELPVAGCDGAFTPTASGDTEVLVTVKAGETLLIDRQSVTFASVLSNSPMLTLDSAIVAAVTALRQRDDASVKAAFQLVLAHRTATCSLQGEDAAAACVAATELASFLQGLCPLVPSAGVQACLVD